MSSRRSAHNLLLLEPPRAGKSMLARRIAAIRPAMRLAEALETIRIHCVAGLTGGRTAVVTTRPFRAPHHTISDVGVIGGGQLPMPEEVSLGFCRKKPKTVFLRAVSLRFFSTPFSATAPKSGFCDRTPQHILPSAGAMPLPSEGDGCALD